MIDAILGAVGLIIYPLFSIIFLVIEVIENVFKAFAGTGDVVIGDKLVGSDANRVEITSANTGKYNDTGIVYYLMQSEIIKNIFVSILVLALFLIIIFTVMAFIKNAYASKQKKWQEIVGNAFIGLANFIFIPVCCLLGVWLGNILLKAIDGATNVNGATSMSHQLFVSAAYNANKLRQEGCWEYDWDEDEMFTKVNKLVEDNGLEDKITVEKRTWGNDEAKHNEVRAYYADIVDKVYSHQEVAIGAQWNVSGWYRLIDINYVLLAGGGCFVIYALASISFGMVKRLFALLMLFVISPAMCALYPLDDGSAVKKWKDDFVRNTISAYGAVVGMNLFFCLAPIIQQINLTGKGNWIDGLGLTSLLLTIAGLYMVKDFINMISGYIGAGNAYTDGAGLMGSTTKRVKSGFKKAGKGISGAFGTINKWRGAVGALGSDATGKAKAGALFSSVGDSLKGGLKGGLKALTGIDIDGARKLAGDKFKEGKAEQKQRMAGVEFKKLKGKYDQALEEQDKAKKSKDPKKIEEAEKAVAVALANLVKHVEDNGLGDEYMKKAAGDKPLEKFKEEIATAKKVKALEDQIKAAEKQQELMEKYLTDVDRAFNAKRLGEAVEEFNKRFGKNLQEIADQFFGGNVRQAAREMRDGKKLPEELRKRQMEAAVSDGDKMKVQQSFDAFNSVSEQFIGLGDAVTKARTAFADEVIAQNGKVDGVEKKTVEELAALREAIMKGDHTDELITTIKSIGDANTDAYRKQIKEIGDLNKELRKHNKDKK